MPTQKHPDIAALIAAAATMTSIGEPISMAVKERIGRAECARLGHNPEAQVNWSGHEGGSTVPYWRQVADDAIVSHWSAECTRRALLVPTEIHARLESLERAVGLSPTAMISAPDPDDTNYKAAWHQIAYLIGVPAQAMSPKEVHEKIVMPKLRALVASKLN